MSVQESDARRPQLPIPGPSSRIFEIRIRLLSPEWLCRPWSHGRDGARSVSASWAIRHQRLLRLIWQSVHLGRDGKFDDQRRSSRKSCRILLNGSLEPALEKVLREHADRRQIAIHSGALLMETSSCSQCLSIVGGSLKAFLICIRPRLAATRCWHVQSWSSDAIRR